MTFTASTAIQSSLAFTEKKGESKDSWSVVHGMHINAMTVPAHFMNKVTSLRAHESSNSLERLGSSCTMEEHYLQTRFQEVANMIGISLSTLAKFLQEGEILCSAVGKYPCSSNEGLQTYANRLHDEHMRLFDELCEDENPSLTLDNPLIH